MHSIIYYKNDIFQDFNAFSIINTTYTGKMMSIRTYYPNERGMAWIMPIFITAGTLVGEQLDAI